MLIPARWTTDQLESARSVAIQNFIDERLREPLELYLEHFDDAQQILEDLLESTIDLVLLRKGTSTEIRAQLQEIVLDNKLFSAFRYLAGPPISEDDLKAVALTDKISRNAILADETILDRLAHAVFTALDRRRFPWVAEDRDPTPAERQAAVLASAALMGMRRAETERRHVSKTVQEEQVAVALRALGFKDVSSRRIDTLTQAPGIGEFCAESLLAGRKADLVVRLLDGRLMPIECKVSNSFTNSVKRLNNDAAVKADIWLQELGRRQVVPAAVLSGLFKRHNLENAQDRGLTLFWAHNLDQLTAWIDQAR